MRKKQNNKGATAMQKEILSLRKRYNLSREDIASKLGVSAISVYRWETGASEPKSRIVLTALDQFKKKLKKSATH